MADFVRNYIKELDDLSSRLLVNRFPLSRWAAPIAPRFKINFDAAFVKDRNEACSGLIVRNARAEVVCSKMVFHENIPSTFAAKAMACLQAIQEANKVAHIITKEGLKKGETTYLQNELCLGVEEALIEDRR
ncbi:hypothetical protein J1N35_005366 [Gossypium stocksii]|uniref:RNase H type-1 domain-containing protein n=1 Tax=Gossypium stocksii TaxID=47602 RepID=A0A9D3WE61_9ROSI|nr:hypothetical protein J1N35_005366 [Gossypium stocksii]